MSVTYTMKQKSDAAQANQCLVSIAAGGIEFQGATTEEERDMLLQYLLDFLARRRAAAKPRAEGKV